LYDVNDTPEGKTAEKYVNKRFGEEVMYSNVDDVSESTFSEYTAFFVGWHTEPKKWYLRMAQPFNKESLQFAMNNYANFDDKGNLIIQEEEQIAHFYNDEREYRRYKINNNDDLIIWREKILESEEEIVYDETGKDESFYYLSPETEGDELTISMDGSICYRVDKEIDDYKEFCKLTNDEK
jgi:hypothetical protein